MSEVDCLILGQGLAGSLLAYRLMQRGERVLVVDDGHASASSTVAAGLINPVTGKRLVKSVGVDACLPVARACYRELASLLGNELLVDKPMLRLFHAEEMRLRWQQRREEPGYDAYLGEILSPAQLPAPVRAKYGAGVQRQIAYLRTRPLLHGLRDWLRQQSAYMSATFAYQDLVVRDDGIAWRDVTAGRVIFCEGYKASQNPWFDWLPFQSAKGEFLTLSCDEPLPDFILNAGQWLMPRGDGRYRLGASYEHEQLDEQVTAEARDMLLQALPKLLAGPPPFQVVGQEAGVRPTTSDRQPFIGVHPRCPGVYIFNGFGSKGSLLIPWHVEQFVGYLNEGGPLPPGCDIHRHWRGEDD